MPKFTPGFTAIQQVGDIQGIIQKNIQKYYSG